MSIFGFCIIEFLIFLYLKKMLGIPGGGPGGLNIQQDFKYLILQQMF